MSRRGRNSDPAVGERGGACVTPKEYHFEPFRLDTVNQCLWRHAAQIPLSPKAFSVLLYLADRPGRLVTKQELLDAVWPDIHVTEGVLKRAVLEIRKALGDPVDEPRFIQTLHRRGYRFLSAVPAQPAVLAQLPTEAGVVGRSREFQQLDTWFEDAVESSRQIVFISGEAGLGKTTLVDTWMNSIRQRGLADRGGAALARGRCLQQFGSSEPYLPMFEALEQLAQILGRRLVEQLRNRAPTWLLHMPALVSLEDRLKLRDEVFGSTRERMLREITDALEALSGEAPLVVALEDLHWSDPSTIDLLSSIARRTSPARLMILATYRPSDAGGTAAPLVDAQNELALHRLCKVLPLDYLSEHATKEYLIGRFPGMDSPELASALHRRTNGNPLYVVCLIDDLERYGGIDADPATIQGLVPETLQQMFERQAAQLNAGEQEMLDVAAVAGESFSVASIAAAVGRDAAEVESDCERLVRRHLILKHGEEFRFPDGGESPGYSFLHALCRDALYRRIPIGRRSRLHGQLGRAEERLYASDPKRVATQLAGHFEFTGERSRAIHYLRLAAEVAASRCSNREAVTYLERAFGLVEQLPDADRATLRMDLLEQRAVMRLIASDMPGSAADFRALADLAKELGAVDRRVRALTDGSAPLLFVDYRQVLAAIEEAQAAQASSPNRIAGALTDLHSAFFEMYCNGWAAGPADLLRSAARELEESEDLRVRSRIASFQAAEAAICSNYAAAVEAAERSRQYARKTGVFFDYFVSSMFLQWALLHRGDLGQAIRVAREGGELAARNDSRMPRVWFRTREAWVHMEAFDFEWALDACQKNEGILFGITTRPNSFPLYLWLGMARLGTGDHEGAWTSFQKVQEALNEGGMAFQCVCPLLRAQAECKLTQADLIEAESLARKLVAVANEHHQYDYEADGHRIITEIASARSDYDTASAAISQARASLDRTEAWAVEWRVHATAAQLFAKLGRQGESEDSRRRSLEAADRVAASLADEPGLQQSFLKRVNGGAAASA
ncbi:MAG: hypothetical protein C5B51_13140 [Terriglobia bacterium]|nr:MAG: hypothetical protein C5B51_13140 [Terriglobia bacterium]